LTIYSVIFPLLHHSITHLPKNDCPYRFFSRRGLLLKVFVRNDFNSLPRLTLSLGALLYCAYMNVIWTKLFLQYLDSLRFTSLYQSSRQRDWKVTDDITLYSSYFVDQTHMTGQERPKQVLWAFLYIWTHKMRCIDFFPHPLSICY